MLRQVVRGGLALGALLLVLAVGVGLTVPGGLSSPGEEALVAAHGGSCSQTVNCTQSSVCVNVAPGSWLYYQYTGVGDRWFDTSDYGLGLCRFSTRHNNGLCTGVDQGNNPPFWWICS
jgi:hypothetical protein